PPYTSGKWGVAQAAHYAQIDMIGKFFKMRGYYVLQPFYADRNGLPVEVYVERTYGINPHEASATPEGRERFLKLCKQVLDKIEEDLVNIWKRLGCTYEYWRNGTDSPEYRKVTQATFIELFRKGLIYIAERPVTWCPRCKTTIAEAEIEYKEETTYLYYIKFKVKETGEDIVIATTRPELLNACDAVIYNPVDERYKHLKSKHAIIPIYGREVRIFEHEFAKPEFGTGLVMLCSYGDINDVRLFRELGLTPRVLINPDGTMNEHAGDFLKGLTIKEARKVIADKLRKEGYLVKVEQLTHSVPVCWRCGTPIEYIHMEEYFLKQLEYRDELLKLLDKMEFFPREHRVRLEIWINSLTMDWPISRTRYYATEIPLWKCSKCGALLTPEPGKYYRPWIDPPPWDKCPKCGAPREALVGEKRVFDTWFDSSISALYVTKYLRDSEFFKEAFGNVLRPQGYDIIRTWLYYSILRVYLLLGKPAFRWVRISGMGLDEKGEAMHKSKGNVVYPEPYIEKYGADAFRFWAAIASKLGSDYRWSEQTVKSGALFATKLWNIVRFASAFPVIKDVEEVKLRPIDYMILTKMSEVGKKVIKAFEKFDVYEPINELYRFTWDIFASHYIEAVKPRAYNLEGKFSEDEQKGAWFTIHKVISTVLKLLAPIMPFITDYLWRQIYGKESIHKELIKDEEFTWESPYGKLLDPFMKANSKVWNYKKSHGLKLSEALNAVLYVPKELEPLTKDLQYFHKLKEVTTGGPPKDAEDLGDGFFIKLLK
ncbi:MAG: valine--tRNA ligase, partial [Thermoprotei archaeon]